MAVKKNPDWHVWMGDVLHWIRTPPGIYIFIIAILGLGLAIQNIGSKPMSTYSASGFPTQAPTVQSQRIVPTSPPPIMNANGCPDGTIYVAHLAGCIPGHRRTIDIFVDGTKNNCPDDAIFSDRGGHCIPMYSIGNYRVFAGNVFTISGHRTAYVYVRAARSRSIAPSHISIGSSPLATRPLSFAQVP